MIIKDRLDKNAKDIETIQAELQQMGKRNQELLQELLRLDGEHRILVELQEEEKSNG